jgi:hypothetical protein
MRIAEVTVSDRGWQVVAQGQGRMTMRGFEMIPVRLCSRASIATLGTVRQETTDHGFMPFCRNPSHRHPVRSATFRRTARFLVRIAGTGTRGHVARSGSQICSPSTSMLAKTLFFSTSTAR